MPTRTAAVSNPNANQSAHLLVTWSGLLNSDDGSPVDISIYRGATLQVTGTFGVGGSVAMEGSNDGGTTWFALNSVAGSAVAVTAAGGVQLQTTAVRAVRPRVTAGDGTTTLVARLFAAGL